jgi:DNA polymerase-4
VRLFGTAPDIAYRAEKEIREALKLPPTAGLAVNKLVSSVAARRSPPCDLIQVRPGDEEPFLAPLEVRLLPAVDRRTYHRLGELNLKLIRQLTEIAPRHLESVLGRKGLVLLRQAKGVDYSPVTPPSATPHISRRAELTEDTNDIEVLRVELFQLIEESLAELRGRGRAARKLQVDILYSDLKSAKGARRLRCYVNQRSVWIEEAEKLLLRILTRRIRVRAMEVRFEEFAADPQAQLGLFDDHGNAQEVRLMRAVDELWSRFGKDAVRFARAV